MSRCKPNLFEPLHTVPKHKIVSGSRGLFVAVEGPNRSLASDITKHIGGIRFDLSTLSDKAASRYTHLLCAVECHTLSKLIQTKLIEGINVTINGYVYSAIADSVIENIDSNWAYQCFIGIIKPDIVITSESIQTFPNYDLEFTHALQQQLQVLNQFTLTSDWKNKIDFNSNKTLSFFT